MVGFVRTLIMKVLYVCQSEQMAVVVDWMGGVVLLAIRVSRY
jgi:hypothetical protein